MATGLKLGIDANSPLITDGPNQGSPAPTVADPAIIADTGAGWVRLNFILGPWSAPEDQAIFQGRNWADTYRTIIQGLRGKGLKIYGLLSNEAVLGEPGDLFRRPPEALSADEQSRARGWIALYVRNFVTIVQMFHQDVSVYESFNEPDDWRGADRNWIHPAWYATMLQDIYAAVKSNPALAGVTLVSGPLQGLGINQNGAAGYLANTYQEGKHRFNWGSGAPFPFEGVGYHLYILEGFNANWPEQEQAVRQTLHDYVQGMKNTIRAAEGQDKPLYISETGWPSNGGHDDFQAQNMALGLRLLQDDPGVALAIWFSTQDFGGDRDNKYYGLYRNGPLTPDNRKPIFAAYQRFMQSVVVAQPLPAFTNQDLINAFYAAAEILGKGGWDLIIRAKLDNLVFNRKDGYIGPDIGTLPGLSDDEKMVLRQQLPGLPGPAPATIAITSAPLKLRAGPDAGQTVLSTLLARTPVQVLDRQGEWLHVKAGTAEGFINGKYVIYPHMNVPEGYFRNRPDLAKVPLAPPQTEQMNSAETDERIASTWNRYGGLLAVISSELKIDPAVAVGVMLAESGGRGAVNGRMIIRFEPHIFYTNWGKNNEGQFQQHFWLNPDPDKFWWDHKWRADANQDWREFHGNQNEEWAVFQFATTLNDTAAKLSISMGATQIMGFNYTGIGYEAVQQMFDAFVADERNQILGFFDFVKGPGKSAPGITALQQGDYNGFAATYNGTGQADVYATIIKNNVDLFYNQGVSFEPGQGLPIPAAPPSIKRR
ncbi:MAG: DUF3380 domain-containing protein [Chloroflexi bacterium]|nr:DUF3380 domain-containing protein [Chloroflexota bacterium]